MVMIPDKLFDPEVDLDFEDEDLGSQGSFSTTRSPLAGNLSQFYDML